KIPAGQPSRLFEALDGTRHTLLLFAGQNRSADEGRTAQAISARLRERGKDRVKGCLVSQVEPAAGEASWWDGQRLLDEDGAAHRRFGARSACLYLVRPDGYIAYRSQPPDADRLAAYLARVFV